MSEHLGSSRRAAVLGAALSAVAFLALLAGGAANARAAAATADADLSPRLAELARPGLSTAPIAVQDRRLELPADGPASLQRRGREVVVNVRFERGAIARLGGLEAAGARILAPSRRYQTVAVAVDPTDLPALADAPGVVSVDESLAPVLRGAGTAAGAPGTCEGGGVISEGLGQLRVGVARNEFGLRGKGITVGVLSDSYDTATQAAAGGPIATRASDDVASNDLPGPAGSCAGQQLATNVLQDRGGGSDEGRAMLQIVHDLAPHAGLAFATAFAGEISFAENIERLARPVAAGGAGAQVIADDVAWLEEPFFQDGPVAAAINKVTADGATYLTATGNDNVLIGGKEVGSWEAPEFRDAEAEGCPVAVQAAIEAGRPGAEGVCMDFDPGTEPGEEDNALSFTLKGKTGVTLDLQWAEPWFGVEADLDAFVVSDGAVVAKATKDNPGKSQRPVEIVPELRNEGSTAKTYELVVNRCVGACNPAATPAARPRLKLILLEENSGSVTTVEYPDSSGGDVVGPTIYGHAGAASAISLGAVPYFSSSAPEPYSSRGPVTHYFAPVSGKTRAAALGEPEEIAKPDLVATDCGATTFFASVFSGAWRLCGTSAAAPHAAAVAALMAQAGGTNEEIREGLADGAAAVGSFGPEAVGAGLLDAVGSLQALGATATSADPASEPVAPLTPSEPSVSPPVSAPPNTEPEPRAAAPTTFFRGKPPKLVKTRRARVRVVFRFGSDQRVDYLCKLDGGEPFQACGARLVRRVEPGRHVLRVRARNADGRLDRTPATFRFRVVRVA